MLTDGQRAEVERLRGLTVLPPGGAGFLEALARFSAPSAADLAAIRAAQGQPVEPAPDGDGSTSPNGAAGAAEARRRFALAGDTTETRT